METDLYLSTVSLIMGLQFTFSLTISIEALEVEMILVPHIYKHLDDLVDIIILTNILEESKVLGNIIHVYLAFSSFLFRYVSFLLYCYSCVVVSWDSELFTP